MAHSLSTLLIGIKTENTLNIMNSSKNSNTITIFAYV